MSSFTPVTVTVWAWSHADGANVSVVDVAAVPPVVCTLAAAGVGDVTVTVTSWVGWESSTTV